MLLSLDALRTTSSIVFSLIIVFYTGMLDALRTSPAPYKLPKTLKLCT
jgi:hypothetical protein